MLESLTVKNFQVHRKTVARFDPRVTTFIGENDAGKSSLLRALRWVCLNKAPTNPMRFGADFMSVRLMFDDGQKVVRRRDSEGNHYSLDGKKFKAFGTEVPEEIAKLLNVGEVNFQKQNDPLFWFASSPGEVSRQLNQIVDLGIIDDAMANIATQVRTAKTEVQIRQADLANARGNKERLSSVVELDEALQEVERLETNYQTLHEDVASLEALVSQATEARKTLGRAAQVMDDAEDLLKAGQQVVDLEAEVKSLGNLTTIITITTRSAAADIPDTESLESLSIEAIRLSADCDTLQALISDIEKAEVKLWDTEQRETQASERLRKLTKGKCPVCGQAMKTGR